MRTAEQATAEYAKQFPQNYYCKLPTGETVSRAGFGTYRTAIGIEVHEQALRKAVLSGINLIDTASCYAFGDSEILIGSVLEDLANENKISADEIVLITKAGYIEGGILEDAKCGEHEGKRIPGIVKLDDNAWHSIHPFFLAEQLNQSLDRLNLLHINIFLLHNPESYFVWAQASGVSATDMREEFYRRIRRAFEYCEKAVASAKISWYGISSNTFGYPSAHLQFCSLEECLNIAKDVAGNDHHFRFVQLPFNLLETGAAYNKNQENDSLSVFEYAQKSGISVLANRPLNALSGDSAIVRLTTQATAQNSPSSVEIDALINNVANIEQEFFNTISPQLQLLPDIAIRFRILLSAGQATRRLVNAISSFSGWQPVLAEQLEPRAIEALNILQQIDNYDLQQWLPRYTDSLRFMWGTIGSRYAVDISVPAVIRRASAESFGEKYTELPFTQIALQSVMATEGVTSALVGARTTEYVDDVLTALAAGHEPLGREHWTNYFSSATRQFGVNQQ